MWVPENLEGEMHGKPVTTEARHAWKTYFRMGD
jgi:hypothetical protein